VGSAPLRRGQQRQQVAVAVAVVAAAGASVAAAVAEVAQGPTLAACSEHAGGLQVSVAVAGPAHASWRTGSATAAVPQAEAVGSVRLEQQQPVLEQLHSCGTTPYEASLEVVARHSRALQAAELKLQHWQQEPASWALLLVVVPRWARVAWRWLLLLLALLRCHSPQAVPLSNPRRVLVACSWEASASPPAHNSNQQRHSHKPRQQANPRQSAPHALPAQRRNDVRLYARTARGISVV
jgi:hypothetical protein